MTPRRRGVIWNKEDPFGGGGSPCGDIRFSTVDAPSTEVNKQPACKKPPHQAAFVFSFGCNPYSTRASSGRTWLWNRTAEKFESAVGSITSLIAVRTLSSIVTSANSGTHVT